jgi:hypothetical protein
MVMFLNKKAVSLVLFLVVLSTPAMASAVSVGVKKGDWIEYVVTSTGTLDESHNVTAAKMQVVDVEGAVVQVNIVSTFSNGTQVSRDSSLNLDTGDLIDNFIVPANLSTGMEFVSIMGDIVKMVIKSSRQGQYCGATRTVVTSTYGGNTYFWDQATGVSVEGYSEGTLNGQQYTMHSLATSTNMWQPDMTLVYAALIVVAIIIVAVVVVLALRRRAK